MAGRYSKPVEADPSSPEQLDKVLRIVSPGTRAVLVGATIMIVAVLIWALTGPVPFGVKV